MVIGEDWPDVLALPYRITGQEHSFFFLLANVHGHIPMSISSQFCECHTMCLFAQMFLFHFLIPCSLPSGKR